MPQDFSAELATYSQALPENVSTDRHVWDEKPWYLRWQAPMSPKTAYFWWTASTLPERLTDTNQLKRTLRRFEHTSQPEDLSFDDAVEQLSAWQTAYNNHYCTDHFFTQLPVVQLLRHFFDFSTSFEIVRESLDKKWWHATLPFLGEPASSQDQGTLRRWFHAQKLDPAERLLRVNLVKIIGTSTDAMEILLEDFAAKRTPGPSSVALAELLDADDWLAWVKTTAPALDKTLIEQAYRKLGDDAAAYLTTRLLSAKRRMDFLPLIDALTALEDPRAIPPLLAIYDRPEASRAAEQTLKLTQPWVIDGLDHATQLRGKIGKTATAFYAQHKNRETSKQSTPTLRPNEYPSWLRGLVKPRKPEGLPRFASLKRLPVLRTSAHMAPVAKDVIYGFLDGLKQMSPDHQPGWVPMATDFFEFESVREFIWVLFHEFSRHGVKPEHLWIVDAVGVFGDDELIFRVMPYAEDWAVAGYYVAAERLVEAIARLQTEASLNTISRYATSSKVKLIRTTARMALARLAIKRGLRPEDLEDRSIDDAGLVEGQTFDYGARSFTLGLAPDLKVVAIDALGQRTPGLPRARKTDTPAMVQRAKNDFALTKKRVSQVVLTQKARMESAMVHGRRWNLAIWNRTFITHPIMRLLTPRVVWAAFDELGKVQFTFRVRDELTLSSIHDTDVVVPEDLYIGLVHPLEIPPESRLAWQNTLADYEVMPLFEQMTRPVYPRPGVLTLHFEDHAIDGGRLRGHFAARGWQILALDETITGYTKSFYDADVRASLDIFPGVQFSGDKKHEQMIQKLVFDVEDMSIADPVSVSEILFDVHAIVDRHLK